MLEGMEKKQEEDDGKKTYIIFLPSTLWSFHKGRMKRDAKRFSHSVKTSSNQLIKPDNQPAHDSAANKTMQNIGTEHLRLTQTKDARYLPFCHLFYLSSSTLPHFTILFICFHHLLTQLSFQRYFISLQLQNKRFISPKQTNKQECSSTAKQ